MSLRDLLRTAQAYADAAAIYDIDCDISNHDALVTAEQHLTQAALTFQLLTTGEELRGWKGYAWKDGVYIGDIQNYFNERVL